MIDRIVSERFGFATNSSSSHSIIIANGYQDDIDDEGYGWQRFILASKEEKMKYLAYQFSGSLSIEKINETIGTNIQMVKSKWSEEYKLPGYIDHQSKMCDLVGKEEDIISFLKDWAAYLSNDDVVILGGNDNDYSYEGDENDE